MSKRDGLLAIALGFFLTVWSVFPQRVLAQSIAGTSSQQSRPRFSITGSLTYETGKFGTNDRAEVLYLPWTLKYLGDSFDVGATIPWLQQRSRQGVTIIEGVPQSGRAGVGKRRTTSGLGDIVLKGRYFLNRETETIPLFIPTFKVKFPTASRADNLGTGEFDYGPGIEVEKGIGKWLLFGQAGFTVIGDPPRSDFRNRWSYGFGVGRELVPNLTGSISIDGKTSVIRGRQAPLDLYYDFQYKLFENFSLLASISAGLSKSSPDYGLTFGFNFKR